MQPLTYAEKTRLRTECPYSILGEKRYATVLRKVISNNYLPITGRILAYYKNKKSNCGIPAATCIRYSGMYLSSFLVTNIAQQYPITATRKGRQQADN